MLQCTTDNVPWLIPKEDFFLAWWGPVFLHLSRFKTCNQAMVAYDAQSTRYGSVTTRKLLRENTANQVWGPYGRDDSNIMNKDQSMITPHNHIKITVTFAMKKQHWMRLQGADNVDKTSCIECGCVVNDLDHWLPTNLYQYNNQSEAEISERYKKSWRQDKHKQKD